MRRMILLITSLLSPFSLFPLTSPDEPATQGSGRVYSAYAEILGIGYIGSVNIDMRFRNTHNGIGMRAGIGYFFDRDKNLHGANIPIQANFLLGKSNHMVEFGAGVTFFLVNANQEAFFEPILVEDIYIAPNLLVGYRYQKAEGGLTFRAGFALGYAKPVLFPYLGVGYSFK